MYINTYVLYAVACMYMFIHMYKQNSKLIDFERYC